MTTTPLAAAPLDAWIRPVLARLIGDDALAALEREAPERLWLVAVRAGAVSDEALLRAAAEEAKLPVAATDNPSPHALGLVDERWARRYGVLPLAATDRELLAATADPFDLESERALTFASGREVRFALASPVGFAARIDAAYGGVAESALLADVGPAVQHLTRESEDAEAGGAATSLDGASASRLVDQLLAAAIAARASDLHIEPEERGIAVRHRVDGVLRLVRVLPRGVGPSLVSRIKILSSLDIADRLRPQDGRARVAVDGHAVDLRISTLPASHGEKVVIRVLDGGASVRTMEAMGFDEETLKAVETLLAARDGLVLVTGPTGSGKTTTLYAALRAVQRRAVNIVTVEDPIEYRLAGVVQVQVHERAGLTFGTALRSIMRQDPDVILVGEIRDRETAEIAIQASLTGHLVFSTLHTNDAASAVTRLVDMGIAPHKIATATRGVIAQRLLRRLCPACRLPDEEARASQLAPLSDARPLRAAGCAECAGTGYRGRLAVAEALVITAEIERRIVAGETAERITAAARRDGHRSLWDAGLAQVAAGATSLDELRRVVGAPAVAPSASAHRSTAEPRRGYIAGSAAHDGSASVRPASPSPERASEDRIVADISVGTIDVYVIRPRPGDWKVLVLQRSLDTRCPTAWEAVHGHIEPGEEPEDAALREVREEAGLEVERLYAITVQPYYLPKERSVQLAVAFCAFVAEPAEVQIGPEHQRYEWLSVDEARARFAWPRERQALDEIVELLSTGDAGPVEDVLRIR